MTHPAEFTVRVENVSTASTLKLSNGTTAPAPTAPVLWLVHRDRDPVFTDGQPDRGLGLESLAEDGNPVRLAGVLRGRPGVEAVGAVAVPVGASEPGPILPGHAYEFTVTASPGESLSLVFMFGQSNDLFFGPAAGIPLFDGAGKPLGGDITSRLSLWDAGTEVNQEPGLGPDQAPRQMADNTGAAEHGVVGTVKDQFTYPRVSDVVRVTVSVSSGNTNRR
jgi:hypothetical protein